MVKVIRKDAKVLDVAPVPGRPLGFGKHFCARMLVRYYDEDNGGWGDYAIKPYEPIPLDPGCCVFHYAQEIFEGLKAFRQHSDGKSIAMFRPDQNVARLNDSARRMVMPTIDEQEYLEALDVLIDLERNWVPGVDVEGGSLYIRPTMIATDPFLGVRPSRTYIFFTILSPVQAYFTPKHPAGVDIATTTKYVRAATGGTGQAKCGGNYAASLIAQKEAADAGFAQVLWLDATEHKYIEEVGAMNMMFLLEGNKLVTAPLDSGTILPGVTRRSIIHMAPEHGITVEERPISVDEVQAAWKDGTLKEVFGCGTAAAITPVRKIVHAGDTLYENPNSEPGPVGMKLRQQLWDIQYGRTEDKYGWLRTVPEGTANP